MSQGAIVLAVRPISGLTSVTNQEAVTGGAEEETDDALYSLSLIHISDDMCGEIAEKITKVFSNMPQNA